MPKTPIVVDATSRTAPTISPEGPDSPEDHTAVARQYTADALRHLREDLLTLVTKEYKVEPTPRLSRANPKLMRIILNPLYKKQMNYDELVAKYVSLWTALETPESSRYAPQALLGLRYLMNGRLSTSQAIFEEIEFHTSAPAAITYVMRGVSVFLRSMAVISFLFFYFIILPSFFRSTPIANPDNLSTSLHAFQGTYGNILTATLAGMLGSVVSLLLRLNEFESTKGRSQMFLLLTGATLPIVGGVFGAFVSSLISSKVIGITVGTSDGLNVPLYLVIGFLSGFSERFSRGFITAAEQNFGGGARSRSRRGG
jgi:hypothetical protein